MIMMITMVMMMLTGFFKVRITIKLVSRQIIFNVDDYYKNRPVQKNRREMQRTEKNECSTYTQKPFTLHVT